MFVTLDASNIHIDMKLVELREIIRTMIKEGNVIDIAQRRNKVQLDKLVDYVWFWRDAMLDAEGALEIVDEFLNNDERHQLRTLMNETIYSPKQKELKRFLQAVIDKRMPSDE